MKRALIIGLLTGIPFGLFAYAAYADDDPSTGLLMGLACGGGAGVVMAGYAAWRDRRWDAWVAKTAEELAGEGLIHHGYANAVDGEAVAYGILFLVTGRGGSRVERGGALILTQQRLVFVPHSQNRVTKVFQVPFAEIAGARAFALARNTIEIRTRDNQSTQFRVRGRDAWLAKLPGVKQKI